MPIKQENKHLYLPLKEWKELRESRIKAQGKRCKFCGIPNYAIRIRYKNLELFNHEPVEIKRSRVVLTIAHLDHNPQNNAEGNTPALCQFCHCRHDITHHLETRKKTIAEKKRTKN
jgi:hypothetical protein